MTMFLVVIATLWDLSMKKYFNDPETFKAAYTSAAKVVVAFLINDFK